MRLSRPGQAFGRYLALSREKQTKLLPLICDHQRWPWPSNNERGWTPSTPLPSVKCAHQSTTAGTTDDPRKVDGSQILAPVDTLIRLTTGHCTTQCLYTFVAVGAPDVIGEEALTAQEMADKLKMRVNVRYLERILRFLATEGILSENENAEEAATYSLTDTGKLLQTNVSGQPSFSSIVDLFFKPVVWSAWGKLHEAVVAPTEGNYTIEGAVPFEIANGKKYFPYLLENMEKAKSFAQAMNWYTAIQLPTVLKYDWRKLNGKTVVDLGGSVGTMMENVANKFPDIGKCFSLDTEDIIRMAPKPKNKNVELVAGDFFDCSTIPKCDAIFMKLILHDWDDVTSKKIIKACHEALNEGGRLIIGDRVVAEIGDTASNTMDAKFFDIYMMVLLGGQERTTKDWEKLLCGDMLFEMEDTIPSKSGFSIISCTKVG